MAPADWKGDNEEVPKKAKDLGLRTESPASADHSKASSITSDNDGNDDDDSFKGVKTSSPTGGEFPDDVPESSATPPKLKSIVDAKVEAAKEAPQHSLADVNAGLDTASSTTSHPGAQP
jgi:hypothetical protein